MKKLIVAIVAFCSFATMVACAPVENNISASATYVYSLRAQYGAAGIAIGVPSINAAGVAVDSLLYAYSVENKFGGIRHFGASAANAYELERILYGLIKKSFDSLVFDARLTDVDELLAPCTYLGADARIIFDVRPYGSNTSIISDTIVEKHRFNFVPTDLSRWTTTAEGQRYTEYVFDKNKVVVLVHSGGDEPTTYSLNAQTGVLTVAAISDVPEHTLTFKTVGGKQCFISSANNETYYLDL